MRRASIAVAAVLALSGCGIRATTVPVDMGAAPSRSRCAEPHASASVKASRPPLSPALPYRLNRVVLYLVCNSQLTERTHRGTVEGDYLEMARRLLDKLREAPDARESEAGYDTAVSDNLRLLPGHAGDPEGTLRLSTQLNQLQDFALGQLVCTFSHDLRAGSAVLLGGPGDTPVRKFTCSLALRTQAGAEPDTGVPV